MLDYPRKRRGEADDSDSFSEGLFLTGLTRLTKLEQSCAKAQRHKEEGNLESIMTKFFDNDWVQLVLRLLIGGVFVWASMEKIRGPQAFADSIATFQVLPNPMINLLALGLPLFEMITGIFLVAGWLLPAGWKKQAAAFSILILTVVFALAFSQAMARGLKVDCGCFGAGRPWVLETWESLVLDLLILAATWLIFHNCSGCQSLSPQKREFTVQRLKKYEERMKDERK